jgi:hypothetical protein
VALAGLLEGSEKKPAGGVNRFVAAEFWVDRALRRFVAAVRVSEQAGRRGERSAVPR